MTSEELLLPRYKVIADYPGMKAEGLSVGQILTCRNYDNDFSEKLWCEMNDAYPHLFQSMMWYEERNEIDLPKYVELVNSKNKNEVGVIFEVSRYESYYVEDADIPHWSHLVYGNDISDCIPIVFCNPATLNEYKNQSKLPQPAAHSLLSNQSTL